MKRLISEVRAATELVRRIGLDEPASAVRRANDALERIQLRSAALDDVVRLLPDELASACDFGRVVVSRVAGSTWLPEVASGPEIADAGFVAAIGCGEERPLRSGTAEAEAVRRRMPALVMPADIPRSGGSCETSYVVSPVVVGDVVIGLIHASAPTGRPLSEVDRAAIRTFADGLGVIVERMVLARRLKAQHRRLIEALVAAEHAVEETSIATVAIGSGSACVRHVTRYHDQGTPAVSANGLTAREAEVLRLLVTGATNAQIADRLTVSETTVKSHVRHILRKLRVSNRAEAIARYLASRQQAAIR